MANYRDEEPMLEAPDKKSEPEPPVIKSAGGSDENGHHRNISRKRSSRSKDDRSHKSSRSKSENKKRHRHHRSPSKSHDRKHGFCESRGSDRKHHRRHHRSRTPSPGRSQSHHRRSRSDRREKEPPTTRHHPRSPVREEPMIPKQRSPSSPDRDARTVFCMQLAQQIRSRDLEDFFSAVGTVREVKLIQDQNSKRFKGIAYVEFKDLESVPLALGLNGQRLLCVPIVVQPTKSEKNKVAAPQLTLETAKQGPTKLYVGNLHENITDDKLKRIFSPFGRVESIRIVKDLNTGVPRGFAFINFAEAAHAKQALDELNGFEIDGRPIKLYIRVNTGSSGHSILDNGQSMGLGLPGNESGGAAGSATETGANGAKASPIATTCFQLSSMFDPTKEIGDDWDKEIADDVIEECQRHGDVMHVYVDKKSQGNVYVKWGDCDRAAKSVAWLHGRYFAGNMITAAYVALDNYHSLFPDARFATTPLKPVNR